jgi:pseudolysin
MPISSNIKPDNLSISNYLASLKYFRTALYLFYFLMLIPVVMAERQKVRAGGFGGNPNTGLLIYDGLEGNLPYFEIERDAATQICYMENRNIKLFDVRGENLKSYASSFPCAVPDPKHNNLYWNYYLSSRCGAYSQANDVFYAATVVNNMFLQWYGVPLLKDYQGDVRQMKLYIDASKDDVDYQVWTQRGYFGNGKSHPNGPCSTITYPYVTMKVVAHELAHGFNFQQMKSYETIESEILSESFSDMTAIAVEYFHSGKVTWSIGDDIRHDKTPIRNLVAPLPEFSIYSEDLDTHIPGSLFSKIYYLMSTQKGWDPKMAYDVMVFAVMNFWKHNSTFSTAACGIFNAAFCLTYNMEAVKYALDAVKLSAHPCVKPSRCPQTFFSPQVTRIKKAEKPRKTKAATESFLRYARG